MRLKRVETGHRLRYKLLFGLIRIITRRRAPDIVRTLKYRPEFFGYQMDDWTQAVMRGPSHWSVAERELLASFTSKLNQCVF